MASFGFLLCNKSYIHTSCVVFLNFIKVNIFILVFPDYISTDSTLDLCSLLINIVTLKVKEKSKPIFLLKDFCWLHNLHLLMCVNPIGTGARSLEAHPNLLSPYYWLLVNFILSLWQLSRYKKISLRRFRSISRKFCIMCQT